MAETAPIWPVFKPVRNESVPVPVKVSVWKISTIPIGTVRNWLPWCQLLCCYLHLPLIRCLIDKLSYNKVHIDMWFSTCNIFLKAKFSSIVQFINHYLDKKCLNPNILDIPTEHTHAPSSSTKRVTIFPKVDQVILNASCLGCIHLSIKDLLLCYIYIAKENFLRYKFKIS